MASERITRANPNNPGPKRLVVCCDGTWDEPDRKAGSEPCPSNVVKFAALVPPSDEGIEQRLLYHSGIGSTDKAIQHWIDGATGRGITRVLVDCYRWLIRNFEPGDQLYFFGFSRGAYTARSLAGFVRNSGILRPNNEDRLDEALALYRSRDARTAPRAAASRLFRQSYSWSMITPIQCVGVWDTVGSLGVPNTMLQGILKHVFRVNREFHDTDLSSTIAYAFHAVAIDEARNPFLPTLWTQTDAGRSAKQHLEQVWFPGFHSDVGGGADCSAVPDVALRWMVERARVAGLKVEGPETIGPPDFPAFKPSPEGPIFDSMTWYYRLFFPSGVRTIDTKDFTRVERMSEASVERWAEVPEWRPPALVRFASEDLPQSERFRDPDGRPPGKPP